MGSVRFFPPSSTWPSRAKSSECVNELYCKAQARHVARPSRKATHKSWLLAPRFMVGQRPATRKCGMAKVEDTSILRKMAHGPPSLSSQMLTALAEKQPAAAAGFLSALLAVACTALFWISQRAVPPRRASACSSGRAAQWQLSGVLPAGNRRVSLRFQRTKAVLLVEFSTASCNATSRGHPGAANSGSLHAAAHGLRDSTAQGSRVDWPSAGRRESECKCRNSVTVRGATL